MNKRPSCAETGCPAPTEGACDVLHWIPTPLTRRPMTRAELVEKMARATYEESRKIHREICARGFFGKPHEPIEEHELPPFEALGRRDKKYRLRRAEAALNAIEAAGIPVGAILSGEWFAAPMAPNFSMIKAGADKMESMDAEKPYPHAARQIWWAMAEKRPAHPQTLGQQIGYEE